jgi:hypothetical protein
MTHLITGSEPFLDRTLWSIGVPPLHIIRARNSREYRFYELTGDALAALHFSDFGSGAAPENHLIAVRPAARTQTQFRIKLGERSTPAPPNQTGSTGRVRLSD